MRYYLVTTFDVAGSDIAGPDVAGKVLWISLYSVSSWSQFLIFSEFNYTNMKFVGHGKFHLKSNV